MFCKTLKSVYHSQQFRSNSILRVKMSDITNTSKDIGELIFSHIEKVELPVSELLGKLGNTPYFENAAEAENYITNVVREGKFYDQDKNSFASESDYDKIATLLLASGIRTNDNLVTELKYLDTLFVYNREMYLYYSIIEYRKRKNGGELLNEEKHNPHEVYASWARNQFPLHGSTSKSKSRFEIRLEMESCI